MHVYMHMCLLMHVHVRTLPLEDALIVSSLSLSLFLSLSLSPSLPLSLSLSFPPSLFPLPAAMVIYSPMTSSLLSMGSLWKQYHMVKQCICCSQPMGWYS